MFVRLLCSILLVYGLLIVSMYLLQRTFIYQPDKKQPQPADWGVSDMQVIQLTTTDQLILNSWYKPAEAGKPTMIYFQGNAGHIGNRSMAMRPYLDTGYGLLLLSYRGYGGNSGQPSERGFYDDARTGIEFLRQQNVAADCLIIYGESLGTAVAVQMATEIKARALILQSPFSRLADVGRHHYRIFPVSWLLKDRFDSISKITSIETPVLILHGDKDRVVPFVLGEKLYDAAIEPKQFVTYSGAAHNNLDGDAMAEQVMKFLKQHSQENCEVNMA